MKYLVYIFLFFSFPSLGQHIMLIPHTSSEEEGGGWTNLVRWYAMDETEGSVCTDDVGTENGTISGATVNQAGKLGKAYSFDGTTDTIKFSTGWAPGSGDWTVAFWCYPDAGESLRIFGGADGGDGPALYLHTDYRPRLMEEGGGGTSVPSLSLTGSAWNFVTIVKTDGNIEYGVNGSYEDETLEFGWDANMIYIGVANQGSNDFDGLLDEFAIFSDAKSEAYLTAMYNSGNGTAYEDGDPL